MTETALSLEFDSLEKNIRYGLQPDNHCLLAAYISIADAMVEETKITQTKLMILYRVANNLLDVICDTYIPEHWRHSCMDVIYKPVHAMEKIIREDTTSEKSNARQLDRFKYELNTLGSYFFS